MGRLTKREGELLKEADDELGPAECTNGSSISLAIKLIDTVDLEGGPGTSFCSL